MDYPTNMCWHIPTYPVTYTKCGHTVWHAEAWQLCETGEATGAYCSPVTETSVASSTNRKYKCPACLKRERNKDNKKKDRGDRDKDHGGRHEISVYSVPF